MTITKAEVQLLEWLVRTSPTQPTKEIARREGIKLPSLVDVKEVSIRNDIFWKKRREISNN